MVDVGGEGRPLMRSARLLTVLLIVGIAGSAGTGSYTLRWGDTLSSVARTFKVPVDKLAAANGITNPNRVREGTRLVIPEQQVSIAKARPASAVAGSNS